MAPRSPFRAAVLLFIVSGVERISASSFLSRAQDANVKELTPELEASIVQEIENMIGGNGGSISVDRLSRIEDMIRATFNALPKSESGRLQHASVRYILHSYFVQRHAWFVRGLASLGAGNVSSPTSVLQDKVEDFFQGAFEQRLGSNGLDLSEVAVLAATYENLVHKEMEQRLNATLTVMGRTGQEDMSVDDVDNVLDVYMMGYILNLNFTVVEPRKLHILSESILQIYPTWPATQSFLREVRQRGSLHRTHFTRSDVEFFLEEVFDQYGRWQDRECQDLKTRLLALEDRSIGVNGSGRVRLTDFYGSALRDGNWQFSESAGYLEQNGALDRHGTERVIIANYINSPSNCVASSKFYSVCCINECEDLMDHVEHHFAAPAVTPAKLIEFISALPSSSVAAGRSLHKILVHRLEEIALRSGGLVPLHGRLFAQWMHHAYPRECPYPHISGTTAPQTPLDFKEQSQQSPVATPADMKNWVESAQSHPGDAENSDECTGWSHHEEIYVGGVSSYGSTGKRTHVWYTLRQLMYAVAAVTALVSLAHRMPVNIAAKKASVSKDVFV